MTTIPKPVLVVQSLGYRFDDGVVLFEDLNFVLGPGLTALTGRNGMGKSLLADLLAGHRQPTSGTIERHGRVAYCPQLGDIGKELAKLTVAEFLGADAALEALQRVARGRYETADYDLIGDDWQLEERLRKGLEELGITAQLSDRCSCLSGGQLARLRTWKIMQESAELLILDEPSNHMDSDSRQWLLTQMAGYPGSILLVSHDRQLLRTASQFLCLDTRGLQAFHGYWDDFLEQQAEAEQALARKQVALQKQKRQLQRKQQLSREKAQRRAAQGRKLRRQGSQAKVLLDKKKESAQAAQSGLATQHLHQARKVSEALLAVQTQREQERPLAITINDSKRNRSRLLAMTNLVLPYGCRQPLTRTINYGDKLHLAGCNGSGKSTLLQVLLGELAPAAGDLQCSAALYYIDQHYSQLDGKATVLANFLRLSGCGDESVARTALASVGFNGDRVSLPTSSCSGGEKMKLAMLAISRLEGASLLLLDEPDNHLDLQARALLAKALADYRGSYLLVSHDEDFVLESGCNGSLSLSRAEALAV